MQRPKAVVITLTLVLIAYAVFLAGKSRAGFPESMVNTSFAPYLADKPIGEDGFYMLTVAWHLAEGRGLVYNYDRRTTGIQPLATVAFGFVAWVVKAFGGDKWVFLRVVIMLGTLNLIMFAHLLGKISEVLASVLGVPSLSVYMLGFSLGLFNFSFFRLFTYGLEAGLYLTLVASCLLLTLKFRSGFTLKRAVVFGLASGLTILCRIDFVVLFLVFLAVMLLRRQISIRRTAISAVVAVVIASPWFIYIFFATGRWMPSSGYAQGQIITTETALVRTWEMIKAVLGNLTPWMYTGGRNWLAVVMVATWLLVFLVLKKNGAKELVKALRWSKGILNSWALAFGILILSYTVFFWATHFYSRYAAPTAVLGLPIIAVSLAARFKDNTRLVAVTSLGLLLAFLLWALLSLHSGRIGNTQSITAGFIHNEISGSTKVGAFQTGVIGYFNDNVINLDGKIDHLALEYSRRHELSRYLDQERVDVLVEWPGYIAGAFSDSYLAENWQSCDKNVPNGGSICLIRKTAAR
jgi:hypothetical protein